MTLLRKPEFYLGLLGLSVALWFALRAAGDTSPGPLSAVHAQVAELADQAGCVACHGEGLAGEAGNAACLHCHESIHEQVAGGFGLHAQEGAQGFCGTCHAEHQGAGFQPVNAFSFARLGIEDALQYDHNHLDFGLLGAHAELKCSACHEHAGALVLEPGQQRFLGLRQDCVACHEDVHEGSMGSDCASCHGQEQEWKVVPLFAHTERFPLTGVHAGQACGACHGGDLGPGIAELSEHPPGAVRDCAACHESPHATAFELASAQGCSGCHSTEHPGFDRVLASAVRPVHDATDFKLFGPHARLDCAACHGPEAFPNSQSDGSLAQVLSFAERHPGRSECAHCHADPHADGFGRGQLPERIQGRIGCARCHGEESMTWAPVESFDHALATGFDLVGAHGAADCTACHQPGDDRRLGALVFPGRGESCADCHQDPHVQDGRGSVAADLRGTAFRESDCHACHNQMDFREVLEFDHGLSGWPLQGAHGRLECADCHAPGEIPRLGPARAPGVPETVACTECHEDPHGQRFDGVAMPAVVAGRQGCARCHGQESFRELPGGRFNHGLWTDFELKGSHKQVRCSDCHGEDASGDLILGKFESLVQVDPRAAAVPCEACHNSPHGNNFSTAATPAEIAGKVGCARCHGELSFRETPAFRHEFTGYALTGAHTDLTCVACHGATAQTPQPPRTGLARLLPAAGRACVDCHADPHGGQFRGRSDPSCAACHTDQRSFQLPNFDHGKTRFPLDDVHEPLACSACHQAGILIGGQEVVRYRPLGIDCVDCHGSVLGGGK